MTVSPLVTRDPVASRALLDRARNVCVVYQGHAMPDGVHPPAARIGVEVNAATGRTVLLVERGLTYTGDDGTISEWLDHGRREFASFAEAGRWLSARLPVVVGGESVRPIDAGLDPGRREAAVDAALSAPSTAPPGYPPAAVLAAEIRRTVRGQDRAVDRLARQVVRHLGRERPSRPATFLLIGPTGVGKTRTAECLAEALGRLGNVGTGRGFLRLDMNEFRERHRVSRLLGAPPGYIGYGDGAPLVEALRDDSHCIVLFDEIDKAHPDVLLVLMNLVDRGRLTGGLADDVDARGAILLFTSNQAADAIAQHVAHAGVSDAELDRLCRRELGRAGLAPELLGRMGTLLPFAPLDERALAEIAADAVWRVGTEYGQSVVSVGAGALRRILDIYRTTALGARPLERAVEECFGDGFLALVEARNSTPVVCDHDGERYTVHPVPQTATGLPGTSGGRQ